jgi:NAD(P)-dependent dehydrogenase (short-subunit alcohol dehydrogenase family)
LGQNRGVIIFVSSISGLGANKGNPAYAGSKAGAISLKRTLWQAWAPDGIRVNGLAPGLDATKLTGVTTEHPGGMTASLAVIPLGSWANHWTWQAPRSSSHRPSQPILSARRWSSMEACRSEGDALP